MRAARRRVGMPARDLAGISAEELWLERAGGEVIDGHGSCPRAEIPASRKTRVTESLALRK